MRYVHDERVILTLDAGGTNFVFSALQGGKEIVKQVCLPSNANNLDKCLAGLVKGFTEVLQQLEVDPVAISFAFPGPADYPRGIIGGELTNMTAFRGGVALGPFLEARFGIPVFINNDGDLFAYGEALLGILPEINRKLAKKGSVKRFKNLLGLTLGTGFGAGIVIKGELLIGDNASAGEIYINRNPKYNEFIVEDSVSIRAINRVYGEISGDTSHLFSPKEVFEIAEGLRQGNTEAAIKSFEELGNIAGDAVANIVAIVDGLIVVGGGLAGANKYILPAMVKQMNSTIKMMDGGSLSRIPIKVYNLEDENQLEEFLNGSAVKINVPDSNKVVDYDMVKRTGIVMSKVGTSKAIMMGAYAFALNEMDKEVVELVK